MAFDPAALRAGDRELYRLIPVAELDVYGLQMRYRWPGLGAPLAASTRPIDASRPGRDMVAPRLQVPVTALLRIPDARGKMQVINTGDQLWNAVSRKPLEEMQLADQTRELGQPAAGRLFQQSTAYTPRRCSTQANGVAIFAIMTAAGMLLSFASLSG